MNGKLIRGSLCFFLFFGSLTAVSSDNVILTVKEGDTLYGIGRMYNVSVQELIQANGIVNPRALKKGLKIQVPRTHVIEHGDTLYGIARRNNITVQELTEYNDISLQTIIKTGQVLMLPSEEPKLAGAELPDNRDDSEGNDNEKTDTAVANTDNPDEGENLHTPVVYETHADNASLMWPHNGSRSDLDGKLKGTEISGDRGDRVVSVSAGEVVWVAPYRGYGTLVMVESRDKHIYAYGGNEVTYVDVGDEVVRGTVLGSLGINPIEKKAKVFFFVYKDGKPVDTASAPRG